MATKEALDRAVKTRKEIRKENQDTVLEDTENKFKHKNTKEDDEYIIQNRGKDKLKDIGYAIGRTETGVAQRIYELKKKGLIKWSVNRNKIKRVFATNKHS